MEVSKWIHDLYRSKQYNNQHQWMFSYSIQHNNQTERKSPVQHMYLIKGKLAGVPCVSPWSLCMRYFASFVITILTVIHFFILLLLIIILFFLLLMMVPNLIPHIVNHYLIIQREKFQLFPSFYFLLYFINLNSIHNLQMMGVECNASLLWRH